MTTNPDPSHPADVVAGLEDEIVDLDQLTDDAGSQQPSEDTRPGPASPEPPD